LQNEEDISFVSTEEARNYLHIIMHMIDEKKDYRPFNFCSLFKKEHDQMVALLH